MQIATYSSAYRMSDIAANLGLNCYLYLKSQKLCSIRVYKEEEDDH